MRMFNTVFRSHKQKAKTNKIEIKRKKIIEMGQQKQKLPQRILKRQKKFFFFLLHFSNFTLSS